MATLFVVQASPNPRGRDTVRPGLATNAQLNEEWVEIEAQGGLVSLVGVRLTNLTYRNGCSISGEATLVEFTAGSLNQGQRLRIHSGQGNTWWDGNTDHFYLGREWFAWNNHCGDRVTLRLANRIGTPVIDWAEYAGNLPESVLQRIPGTNRLVPMPLFANLR